MQQSCNCVRLHLKPRCVLYIHTKRLFFTLGGGDFWEDWVHDLKFYPAGIEVDPLLGCLEVPYVFVLME